MRSRIIIVVSIEPYPPQVEKKRFKVRETNEWRSCGGGGGAGGLMCVRCGLSVATIRVGRSTHEIARDVGWGDVMGLKLQNIETCSMTCIWEVEGVAFLLRRHSPHDLVVISRELFKVLTFWDRLPFLGVSSGSR